MMWDYGPGLGYSMMGGWVGMIALFFFLLLIIAGAVLVAIWAVRTASRGGGTPGIMPPAQSGHDDAQAIARRRFASGEINKEQFDEIMRALGG